MRTIKISALVLRGQSVLDSEKPDEQTVALLLESGALRDERPVITVTPDVIGFQTLVALILGQGDESKPIRISLEANIPEKTLADCVSSDFEILTIFI